MAFLTLTGWSGRDSASMGQMMCLCCSHRLSPSVKTAELFVQDLFLDQGRERKAVVWQGDGNTPPLQQP
jgi:hypothetical protein